MDEHRRHTDRRETLAHWPAQDAANGESVGLVTNLSEKGVEIHSKHGFTKGQTLTIRIAVDAKLSGTDSISLVVENIWCRASGVPDLFHAGFKIVDISDRAKRALVNLMQAFSYLAPPEKI
jgi:hypothetical protein